MGARAQRRVWRQDCHPATRGRAVERRREGPADQKLPGREAGDRPSGRDRPRARLPQDPRDAATGERHAGAEDEPAGDLGRRIEADGASGTPIDESSPRRSGLRGDRDREDPQDGGVRSNAARRSAALKQTFPRVARAPNAAPISSPATTVAAMSAGYRRTDRPPEPRERAGLPPSDGAASHRGSRRSTRGGLEPQRLSDRAHNSATVCAVAVESLASIARPVAPISSPTSGRATA